MDLEIPLLLLVSLRIRFKVEDDELNLASLFASARSTETKSLEDDNLNLSQDSYKRLLTRASSLYTFLRFIQSSIHSQIQQLPRSSWKTLRTIQSSTKVKEREVSNPSSCLWTSQRDMWFLIQIWSRRVMN